MRKLCGIYCIENLITFQKYVGSSINILHRFGNHKATLRHNKHKNDYLQSSWNKYGEENFIFRIIEFTSNINLEKRERYWIDFYKSTKK